MATRILIVDDEALARHRIKRLLGGVDSVEIIASAENGQQAVDLSLKHQPDLIFMDIQMPIKSGLVAAKEIIEQQQNPPSIVFCTAFDQHAVDAFKLNAAAYLLKPVMQDDLVQAIEQAGELSKFQLLQLESHSMAVPAISVQHASYVEKLLLSDILYFRSEQKNVVAGMKNNSELIVDYTLKELESQYSVFLIRAHRNSLVNKNAVLKLTRDDGGQDFLELHGTDLHFEVSRRNLAAVKGCF